MSVAAFRFDNAKRRRPEDHDRQVMLTPRYILDPLRKTFECREIELDPCTEADNPTEAVRFYTPPQDGCELPWNDALSIFVNPPYGQARDAWVKKCLAVARLGPQIALLIPAHTDTRTAQLALNAADSVLFVRGRLRFEERRANQRHAAASHGSMLLGFNLNLTPMGSLGAVFQRAKETTL